MTQFPKEDFVSGLRSEVRLLHDGLHLCLALRLQDGRLPVVALDAEFCLNLEAELSRLLAHGFFDIDAQLGPNASMRRQELAEVSAAIPLRAFLGDMEAAAAHERSVNLHEEGAIELDLILVSGWDATVWFDAAGSCALAQAISKGREGGLKA